MNRTVYRRVALLSTVAVVVALMAACGGGSTKATSATSPVTALTVTTTSSVPTTEGSTTSVVGRSPVPTTGKASAADVEIDRTFVPEATASYEFSQTALNGTLYSNALVMTGGTSPQKVEINAGRNHAKFRGVLGVPDDGKSSSNFQVDISLDGAAPVFSALINFGETKDIDVDVSNILRIKITVVSKGSSYGNVAIGNPRFA